MADVSALHTEMFEAVEARDFDRLRELYHPQYRYWSNDGTEGGPDVGVQVAKTYTGAMSDLSFETLEHTVCGTTSVLEFIARGTHDGQLEDIAPTGKKVEIRVCNVIEEKDGTIFREREYFNVMAIMEQLGLAPT